MANWLLWCRLCGKDDPETNRNIDLAISTQDCNLLLAMKKFFDVDLSMDDHVPMPLCTNCIELLKTLSMFSKRVIEIQKMFAELQQNCIDNGNHEQQILQKYNMNNNLESFDIPSMPKHINNSLEDSILDMKVETERSEQIMLNEILTETNESHVEELIINLSTNLHDHDEIKETIHQSIQNVNSNDETNEKKDRQHLKRKHSKISPVVEYQCKECNQVFKTNHSLKRHENIHLPAEILKVHRCSYCDEKFYDKDNVSLHIKSVHSEEMPFECLECHGRFKTAYKLRVHKQSHTDGKYKCRQCGWEFSSRTKLYQHSIEHSKVKPHQCDYCDRAFKTLQNLKAHLLIHAGLKPYSCDFCERSFTNSGNCHLHEKKYHPNEFAAQVAAGRTKKYANSTNSIPNLDTLQSLIRNNENFASAGSKSNFQTAYRLNDHTNTDEKQHECEHCGRSFKKLQHLKAHLIIHAGLKPYSCDFCQVSFANPGNCHVHEKKQHPKEFAAQHAIGRSKKYANSTNSIPNLDTLQALIRNSENRESVGSN